MARGADAKQESRPSPGLHPWTKQKCRHSPRGTRTQRRMRHVLSSPKTTQNFTSSKFPFNSTHSWAGPMPGSLALYSMQWTQVGWYRIIKTHSSSSTPSLETIMIKCGKVTDRYSVRYRIGSGWWRDGHTHFLLTYALLRMHASVWAYMCVLLQSIVLIQCVHVCPSGWLCDLCLQV